MTSKWALAATAAGAGIVLAVALLAAPSAQETSAATRLASLEADLATLDVEVERLEDTKAIRRLQRAYGYYVDKKLGDEIAALFSTDATAEIGGLGVFVGRDRIAELYDFLLDGELRDGQLFNHMILQGVVHVAADGRTAKGRWRALIQLGEHGQSATWSEGPYENEYVKENGIWKISKLHWYMTLAAPYDPGWHRAQIPMDRPSDALPPDRPPSEVYGSYPSAYLPAYHYDNPVSGPPAQANPATVPSHAEAHGDLTARAAAARAQLADLERRAARVSDVNEIENLQRTYGYYLDKMLWEHVIDLFADDATMEIGSSGVFVGKDSIRGYLYSLSDGRQGPIEGVLYDHMQLQPIVTVASDGLTAKGRWRAWIQTGTSGSGSGGNWGEGPYENEYVKQDGVWKISKLHWYATYYVPYEGGWLYSSAQAVRQYSEGRGVEPDQPPSEAYEPYPAAFMPPFHYANPGTGE